MYTSLVAQKISYKVTNCFHAHSIPLKKSTFPVDVNIHTGKRCPTNIYKHTVELVVSFDHQHGRTWLTKSLYKWVLLPP